MINCFRCVFIVWSFKFVHQILRSKGHSATKKFWGDKKFENKIQKLTRPAVPFTFQSSFLSQPEKQKDSLFWASLIWCSNLKSPKFQLLGFYTKGKRVKCEGSKKCKACSATFLRLWKSGIFVSFTLQCSITGRQEGCFFYFHSVTIALNQFINAAQGNLRSKQTTEKIPKYM